MWILCITEPWRLTVGELQVDCRPRCQDGVDRLAVCRGLLTCCRNDILVSHHGNQGVQNYMYCFHQERSKVEHIITYSFFCFIRLVFSWMGCSPSSQHFVKKSLTVIIMFFKVQALYRHASFCRLLGLCTTAATKVIGCIQMCFLVFTIWLKRLKECLNEVWEVTGAPLDSDLQQHLTQIIWSNAESPVSLLCAMKPNILYFHVYEFEQITNTKYGVSWALFTRAMC